MSEILEKIYHNRHQKKKNIGDRVFKVYQDYLRKKKISQIWNNLDLKPKRVLDIGCGDGWFLRFAQSELELAEEYDLVGVDILESQRKLFIERCSPKLKVYNSLHCIYGVEKFDLVSTFTVFSSILNNNDRSKLIESIAEKTQKHGYWMNLDIRVNNPMNQDVRRMSYDLVSNDRRFKLEHKSLLTPPPFLVRNRYLRPFGFAIGQIPPFRIHELRVYKLV